ncbi:hypothetical protein HJG60_007909 [Phyllostomus discolor]|uniref:Uncharacterized protein n=1 Tax=Phyllostomus discolor TaxID=89673 RepID=A0A834BMX1_9CHIR|nr:hypothetical protein HJG60_007909 [Phyllostomus discolor]
MVQGKVTHVHPKWKNTKFNSYVMAWGKNGDTVFLQKASELVFSSKMSSFYEEDKAIGGVRLEDCPPVLSFTPCFTLPSIKRGLLEAYAKEGTIHLNFYLSFLVGWTETLLREHVVTYKQRSLMHVLIRG